MKLRVNPWNVRVAVAFLFVVMAAVLAGIYDGEGIDIAYEFLAYSIAFSGIVCGALLIWFTITNKRPLATSVGLITWAVALIYIGVIYLLVALEVVSGLVPTGSLTSGFYIRPAITFLILFPTALFFEEHN